MTDRVPAASPGSPARTDAARARRSGRRARAANWPLTGAVLLALIAGWEIVVRLGLVDERFISRPVQVVTALGRLSADPAVRKALVDTIYALGISFGIGAALGLVAGMILGLNTVLREAYLPVVVLLLGIPKTVFLPLFILFFGMGVTPGIAFGVLLCSIQVVVNVIGGVDSVDAVHFRMARAFGASRLRLFTHVILPGAAPGIFAGLWHGIRNAFIGVVVAQLFISNVGVGYLVRLYSSNFRIDDALALVFFIAAVVIAVGMAWEYLERRMSRWKEPAGARM